MGVSGQTIKHAEKITDLERPEGGRSLSEWCIEACGGDSLLALDLAVRTYEAMRRSGTPAAARVG